MRYTLQCATREVAGRMEIISNRIALTCFYRPRSEGDNVIGSIRPSVCVSLDMFVRALLFELFDLGSCNQGAYGDNLAEAVDRLLIYYIFSRYHRNDMGISHYLQFAEDLKSFLKYKNQI